LPSSLSDLAGWSKVTKQKPKKTEPATVHKDKPEKSNDKPNEKPSDKASSKLHATVNSRKSTDKALAKPEKAEKGAVPEAQKPKNPLFFFFFSSSSLLLLFFSSFHNPCASCSCTLCRLSLF